MAFEWLPQMISDIISDSMSSSDMTNACIGTVTSIDPIEIEIDAKTKLGEEFLFFLPFVKQWDITSTDEDSGGIFNFHHTHVVEGETEIAGDPPHTHQFSVVSQPALLNITMWRGLRQGDGVLMMRCSMGSKYLILTRLDGFSNLEEEQE